MQTSTPSVPGGEPTSILDDLRHSGTHPTGRALVLIPTYNEAPNVRRVIDNVLGAVPADVLVIDDNSPDGTGLIAAQLAAEQERVSVMHRPAKSGLGRAYVDGMRWALDHGYDFVVQMDCDSSHDPAAAALLLERLDGAHVVVGSRYVSGGATVNWPLPRRILSRVGSLYSRFVLGLSQRDATSGFKAWRCDVLRRIDLAEVRSSGYGFQVEMAFLAEGVGATVDEVPIVFPNRDEGHSKLSIGIIGEALLLVLRLRLSRAPWAPRDPLPITPTAPAPARSGTSTRRAA